MDEVRNPSKIVVCFFVAALLCLLPCVSAFSAEAEDSVELRVKRGDELWHICGKYLGHPEKWREVAKFNHMKNPDFILPGQTLKVPVKLIPGVPMEGNVTFVHGDARVQKGEGAEWTALHSGDLVSQGSTVKTGKASSLQVAFDDRSSIFLRSDTTLGITASEKKGLLYRVNRFYLAIGRVVARLKEATGSDSRMDIRTPSAIASVRGTEFRVSADEEASTRTEVLAGAVGVRAAKTTVPVREGEGTYVQRGAAPASPRKLLLPPEPVDLKAIYKELPLRFAFGETVGLSSVRGLLTKDIEGRDVQDEKVVGKGESLEFVPPSDGTYYLFSQGIDELGIEGFPSRPHEVRLRANPLPPLVQRKDDEAEFVGNTARFTWLKVKDAAAYHIQVARDGGFAVMEEERPDCRSESYETGALDHGAHYFRISSVASDGYEAGWSETMPFRLVPPPPAPLLEKPATGERGVLLKWRDLGEGITYHFQMAGDAEFQEILVDEKLEKPGVTLQKPKKPGVYHVRISSIDRKNREGEFSPSQTFEVERFPYGVLGGIAAALGLILLLAP
jgi:hypothetical protein